MRTVNRHSTGAKMGVALRMLQYVNFVVESPKADPED